MTRSGSRRKTPRFLPISESAATPEAHVALVPGEDLPLIQLELPTGLRGAVREQVAQRQITDTLGLNSDVLDMRPFKQSGATWTRMLVADRSQLENWCKLTAGTSCTAILPDYLSLPTAEDVWTLEMTDGRIVARLGLQDGFASELPIARMQLNAAVTDTPPQAVLWADPRDPEIEDAFAKADIPVRGKSGELLALGLSEPVYVDPVGVNLMETAGASQSRRRARIARWRVPFVLALLALGIWLAGQLVGTARLLAQANATTVATTEIVRRVFVPAGPLLDIRAQVARRVIELTQTSEGATRVLSPVILLQRAAASLVEPGINLQSISFRSDTGLELVVEAPNFAALDALVATLRAANLAVEMTNASSDDQGGVSGRLQVREPS